MACFLFAVLSSVSGLQVTDHKLTDGNLVLFFFCPLSLSHPVTYIKILIHGADIF